MQCLRGTVCSVVNDAVRRAEDAAADGFERHVVLDDPADEGDGGEGRPVGAVRGVGASVGEGGAGVCDHGELLRGRGELYGRRLEMTSPAVQKRACQPVM